MYKNDVVLRKWDQSFPVITISIKKLLPKAEIHVTGI